MNRKFLALVSAAALAAFSVVPASAHELMLRPADKAEAGTPVAMEIHSGHRFIVPEEVEDVEAIEAGIFVDGKFVKFPIKGNDAALCIDFTIPELPSGAAIVLANKNVDPWCIWCKTNKGWKMGGRKELEDKGFKVLKAMKFDKFAKLILNPVSGDDGYAAEAGTSLEIIPVTNPADIKVGDDVEVKIIAMGKPYNGKVWATYDGFDTEHENVFAIETEAKDGKASFKVTAPGLWLVRAYSEYEGKKDVYDKLSLRAMTEFYVK